MQYCFWTQLILYKTILKRKRFEIKDNNRRKQINQKWVDFQYLTEYRHKKLLLFLVSNFLFNKISHKIYHHNVTITITLITPDAGLY